MREQTYATLGGLRDLLNRFIEARNELSKALDEEAKEIPELVERRREKAAEFLDGDEKRKKGLPPTSAEDLSDFIHDTPEQKRIDAVTKQRNDAERRLRQLRLDMGPLLDRLRNKSTAESFGPLDNLLLEEGLVTIDRVISLVESILGAPGVMPRPRKKWGDSRLEDVKSRIKEMRDARMSHKEICEHLGNAFRPRGAAWAHLSWSEAFAHSEYRAAVAAFISKQR